MKIVLKATFGRCESFVWKSVRFHNYNFERLFTLTIDKACVEKMHDWGINGIAVLRAD